MTEERICSDGERKKKSVARRNIFEKIRSPRERIIKIAGSLGPPSATRLAKLP